MHNKQIIQSDSQPKKKIIQFPRRTGSGGPKAKAHRPSARDRKTVRPIRMTRET